jgi:hypothetical protein
LFNASTYHDTKALLCVLSTFNPGDVKPDILMTIGLEGGGQLDQEDFRFKFDDDRAYDHSVEDLNSTKLLAPTWFKIFAKKILFDYIECLYNPRRRHLTIGYMSLVEFEALAGVT